jgi:hypothetical protein
LRAEGAAWSAQGVTTVVNLGFLDWSPPFLHFSSSSVILTRLSGPRSRTTTSQKNLVAAGIEPGTLTSVAKNLDHYTIYNIVYIFKTVKLSP